MPGRRKRRWRKWVIGLVVVAAVIVVVHTRKSSADASSGEPLKNPIALEHRSLDEHLLETGVVELQTTIDVKSKLSGKVKKLLVEQGDAVEKGQVLAVIEPDPNEILRLYQKRAAVESRRIALQEMRRDLDRAVTLHDKGVMPGDQFEKARDRFQDAETAYRLALMELQALDRELDPSGANEEHPNAIASSNAAPAELSTLTDVRVLSPLRGIVIERPVEVGELVLSGTATMMAGTTIMTLGNPADAVLRAAINEVDIGKLAVGQEAEVTLIAYEEEVFPARIERISPIGKREEERNIVTFSVEVALEQLDPRILPGMTCDLDIIIDSKQDAACLPHRALFQEPEKKEEEGSAKKEGSEELQHEGRGSGDRTGGGFFESFRKEEEDGEERRYLDYVWVKEGGDWVKREVKVGIKGEKYTEILDGVTAEDKIYPDAEHMRWIVAERERRAQRRFKWPWEDKAEE